jgi:hypothetical protein
MRVFPFCAAASLLSIYFDYINRRGHAPKANQHEIDLVLTTINSSLKALAILDKYNRKNTPQIPKLRSFALHFSSKIGDNQ